MALFIAEHTHPGERCPAQNPQMAAGLLAIIHSAGQAGIRVHGDAVANGGHHLYLIVEAENEKKVRDYFAPFGQMGTLKVTPASHCEEVVERGAC
ncbi:MAG TPA: DUF3303 family protein [Thermoplasmata archaeon]|nr:DUF3303 family protein [Thermoplasmata archaeon]